MRWTPLKLYRENERRERSWPPLSFSIYFLKERRWGEKRLDPRMPAGTTALPCPRSIITTSPMPPLPPYETKNKNKNLLTCIAFMKAKQSRNMAARVFYFIFFYFQFFFFILQRTVCVPSPPVCLEFSPSFFFNSKIAKIKIAFLRLFLNKPVLKKKKIV